MSSTDTVEKDDDDDSEDEVKMHEWAKSAGHLLTGAAKFLRAVSNFF
ncbi:hypothetical protein [Salinibacter grassmerensis]|nr:hypothetical protein [Salinibacter grassmerensis]